MRLIHLPLALLMFALAPLTGVAANAGASVRAIEFVASHQRGPTDPRLAPYEAILRRNLRYQSFHFVGESSASVSAGGRATLVLPQGGRVELHAGRSGTVQVTRGGTIVTVSRGRPAVFMNGPAGRGDASGIIVMAN